MNREDKRNINNKSGKPYNLNKQMKVDELKAWSKDINPDWPTDKEDERMNIVIHNGNIGYKEI